MAGLRDALSDIEAAEGRARALRASHGARAEAQCQAELSALRPRDPRRSTLRDVLKALRWVAAGSERKG